MAPKAKHKAKRKAKAKAGSHATKASAGSLLYEKTKVKNVYVQCGLYVVQYTKKKKR
jgi:hypothetical protein